MNPYIAELKQRLTENPPSFGDGDSILTMLYESYSDANRMDDDRIKTDFRELYQAMNGMPFREMDRITDPICALCRDHEQAGFVEGVKVGILLAVELTEP